ncbi:MAG: LPXTG cell wall anchor domain-containing protein [Acidimicrobiales bacterium]
MVIRHALRPALAALLAAFALFAFSGAASAQTDDYTEQPAPVVQSTSAADPAPVAPAPVVRSNDDALPVTGSDVVGLAVVGGVLVMAGGVVLTARRRAVA